MRTKKSKAEGGCSAISCGLMAPHPLFFGIRSSELTFRLSGYNFFLSRFSAETQQMEREVWLVQLVHIFPQVFIFMPEQLNLSNKNKNLSVSSHAGLPRSGALFRCFIVVKLAIDILMIEWWDCITFWPVHTNFVSYHVQSLKYTCDWVSCTDPVSFSSIRKSNKYCVRIKTNFGRL